MDELPKTTKQLFYDLCIAHNIDYSALTAIADEAHVSHDTVKNMFCSNPVAKRDAESVLKVFSRYIRVPLSLNTVAVILTSESEAPHA